MPLDVINRASAKEKSIRHGHPSTLHLWWARRPLAAARAVLFAQLVDDPSENLDDFPTEESQEDERQRLFGIIEELVKWENTTNEDILEVARKEIQKVWERTCDKNAAHHLADKLFVPSSIPGFHDPFAGGGALPLEAQRLGLESFASDLNPVAVLINKAMIEIPAKFLDVPPVNPEAHKEESLVDREWKNARGLAEDVRYYGRWIRDEAEKRIENLYPAIEITSDMALKRPDLERYVGQKLTAIAWIWARTVKSPNPVYADVDVPLVSTFMLSTKKGREAFVKPIIGDNSYQFSVELGKPADSGATKAGTKLGRGANFQCLMSGAPIASEYVKEEGKAGRMGVRLMAIVAKGDRERIYLPPSPEHEAIAKHAQANWRPALPLPDDPRNFWTVQYGLSSYGDLFTARQLVALTTFADLVGEARELIRKDAISLGMPDDELGLQEGGAGARAYSDSVGVYLAFAVSKAADRNTSLCFWEHRMDRLRGTFGRQSMPMIWDFAETNPFAGAGGDIYGTAHSLSEVLDKFVGGPSGVATQADAANQDISFGKVVSTDPPYYDNIAYADLSDFFYGWLRRSLSAVFPDLFATVAVPKADELVASAYRHGGKEQAERFFLDGMTSAMNRLSGQVHPAFPVTIYYAFKQSETKTNEGTASTGWETFFGRGYPRRLLDYWHMAYADRATCRPERQDKRAGVKRCTGLSSQGQRRAFGNAPGICGCA